MLPKCKSASFFVVSSHKQWMKQPWNALPFGPPPGLAGTSFRGPFGDRQCAYKNGPKTGESQRCRASCKSCSAAVNTWIQPLLSFPIMKVLLFTLKYTLSIVNYLWCGQIVALLILVVGISMTVAAPQDSKHLISVLFKGMLTSFLCPSSPLGHPVRH